MKKLLMAAFALLFAVALSACSGGVQDSASSSGSSSSDGDSCENERWDADGSISVADASIVTPISDGNLPCWVWDFGKSGDPSPITEGEPFYENVIGCDLRTEKMNMFENGDVASDSLMASMTEGNELVVHLEGASQTMQATDDGIFISFSDKIPSGAILQLIPEDGSGEEYVVVVFHEGENSYIVPWDSLDGEPSTPLSSRGADGLSAHIFACTN